MNGNEIVSLTNHTRVFLQAYCCVSDFSDLIGWSKIISVFTDSV